MNTQLTKNNLDLARESINRTHPDPAVKHLHDAVYTLAAYVEQFPPPPPPVTKDSPPAENAPPSFLKECPSSVASAAFPDTGVTRGAAVRIVTGWVTTAQKHARNEQYYLHLLARCAKALGKPHVHLDAVPSCVDDLLAENADLRNRLSIRNERPEPAAEKPPEKPKRTEGLYFAEVLPWLADGHKVRFEHWEKTAWLSKPGHLAGGPLTYRVNRATELHQKSWVPIFNELTEPKWSVIDP